MRVAATKSINEESKGIDVLQVYPIGFTFFCAIIFVMPVVKNFDLAIDTDVRFWMGIGPFIPALTPPGFIVLAYMINRTAAASSKSGTVLALIGSNIALLIVGDQVGSYANFLADTFSSTDCRGYADSMDLEKQLSNARQFYKTCLENADYHMPITECDEYDDNLYKNYYWPYLQQAEMRFACTGWCEAHDPLWNYGATGGDRCGLVVGELMRTKVFRTSSQILVWNIIIVAMTSVALSLLLPSIRKAGLDW